MLEVRNLRTGVTGKFPKKQALWLVELGRCELVKSNAPVAKVMPQSTPDARPQATDKVMPENDAVSTKKQNRKGSK